MCKSEEEEGGEWGLEKEVNHLFSIALAAPNAFLPKDKPS